MEPTSQRMTKTRDEIERVRKQNDILLRRVDEMEFILHKSHKQNTLYRDLEDRVSTVEDKMKDFKYEVSKKVEHMQFQTNTYQEKHTALGRNLDMLNGRCDDMDVKVLKSKNEVTVQLNAKIK